MGESQRSKTATGLEQELKALMAKIGGTGTSVENRFDNYNLPFDYQSMSKIIDEITQGNIGEVNRLSNQQILSGQGDAAERMASAGVTSSSIKDSQFGKIRGNINSKRYGLTQQLLTDALGQKKGAMSEENKNRFDITGAASGVDLQNMMNLFRKYGLVSSVGGQRVGNLGNLSDNTWLTDVLAVVNTAANFIPFAGGGDTDTTTGGGGQGLNFSDRRLKENINRVGISPSGINIYEFNFIGHPGRYRGVMAQEVPGVTIEYNGIKYVDYSKIDVKFEVI